MTFRRSFLLIALAMFAWPAYAADINKEGAARVKTLVELLDRRAEKTGPRSTASPN